MKKASYDYKKFPNITANVARTKQATGIKEYLAASNTYGLDGLTVGTSCAMICKTCCQCCACCTTVVHKGTANAQLAPAPQSDAFDGGTPELFYFDGAGRGELARMIAAVGDLTITSTNPGATYKDLGLFGNLPILKHGGLCIGQSTAIDSYFAAIAPKFKG